MAIALFTERFQLHNNENHKRSSNSNEIIISFVCRFVLFQCAAVSTNGTWNGGCIHSTRVAYVFIFIHNKLGRFHASTAYGRVIQCPTINLNNTEAHTRARMLLSLFLSPSASLFVSIFDFIMISKQTRAREWNVDVGVTANRKEAKSVPYFSDLRMQLHETYQTAIILLLFMLHAKRSDDDYYDTHYSAIMGSVL